jgi:hypothetical protein
MEEIWKTTSIFRKSKTTAIFLKGRQPQFFRIWDDLKQNNANKRIRSKNNNSLENGRRTHFFLLKEDDLNFLKMEDDLLQNNATQNN